MGRKKRRVITGYQYRLGIHSVLGHANMDGISRIRVGEKVAWQPTAAHPEISATEKHLTGTLGAMAIWAEDDGGIIEVIAAQTFKTVGAGHYCNKVRLWLARGDDLDGEVWVQICNVDPYGQPNETSVVANSLLYGVTSLGGHIVPPASQYPSGVAVDFSFPTNQFWLEEGETYALAIRNNSVREAPKNKQLYAQKTSDNSFADGKLWQRTGVHSWVGWGASDEQDLRFTIYPAEGSYPNHSIVINKPSLFGGNKKEGGITGLLSLLFGSADQGRDSYLRSKCDLNIPAFRGVTSIVHRQAYVGNSPYIKPWSYLCRRITRQVNGDDQWYLEKAHIRPGTYDDLNAAHIIRECLIDKSFGVGFETSDIDDDSFRDAADILFDEGFGLSLVWDQESAMEDFIGSVLSMIAGFLYQDLSTGKWILSLTREQVGIVMDTYDGTGILLRGSSSAISSAISGAGGGGLTITIMLVSGPSGDAGGPGATSGVAGSLTIPTPSIKIVSGGAGGDAIAIPSAAYEKSAQSFQHVSGFTGTTVSLSLSLGAGSPGNVTVDVYAADGSGYPTGALLATDSFAASSLASYPSFTQKSIDITPAVFSAGTPYCFVISTSSGNWPTSYIYCKATIGNPYADGILVRYNGSVWSQHTTTDIQFTMRGY